MTWRSAGAVARSWCGAVTPLGWSVTVLGFLSWAVASRLGWREAAVLAGACLLLLGVGIAFAFRPSTFAIDVSVSPQRVVAGERERAVGGVVVRNATSRRSFAARIEVTVGHGVAEFEVPPLSPDADFSDGFVITAPRRSVIQVGPAQAVKGDPLGLIRREAALSRSTELYVHPVTVAVPSVASGWMRDLEGRTTNDLAVSDVAFHALREYVAGDDRRHIHWRTTARLNKMMVRQFVDTRQSQLGLVLGDAVSEYASDDEFELAVSVVASIARSAARDEQELACVAGGRLLASHTAQRLLDQLSGVSAGSTPISATARLAVPLLTGASIVVVVVGSNVGSGDLNAAIRRFPIQAKTIAIRCVLGSRPSLQSSGSITVLGIGSLDDLARSVRGLVGS